MLPTAILFHILQFHHIYIIYNSIICIFLLLYSYYSILIYCYDSNTSYQLLRIKYIRMKPLQPVLLFLRCIIVDIP